MDVTDQENHRLKLEKKNEKLGKCQNLAKELRKLWNLKVTVVSVIVGTLGTIPKSLGNKAE